jgi:hypothetical protein
MTKEPQLMKDNTKYYIQKAIECYSGHALTDEVLIDMVMTLSKGSVSFHDAIREIQNMKR